MFIRFKREVITRSINQSINQSSFFIGLSIFLLCLTICLLTDLPSLWLKHVKLIDHTLTRSIQTPHHWSTLNYASYAHSHQAFKQSVKPINQSKRRQLEHVEIFPIFQSTEQSDPFDSTGEIYYIKGQRPHSNDQSINETIDQPVGQYVSYPVCSFTHVCVTMDSIKFRWKDPAVYQANKLLIESCLPENLRTSKPSPDQSINQPMPPKREYDLCKCFYYPQFKPDAIPHDMIHDSIDQSIKLSYKQSKTRPGRSIFDPTTNPAFNPSTNPAIEQSLSQFGSVSNDHFLEWLPRDDVEYSTDIQSIDQSFDSFSPYINPIHSSHAQSSKQTVPGRPAPLPGSLNPPIFGGHYWTFHKYVPRSHHIGHWAQRVMIFASVMQHFLSLPLPPLQGLIIQDTSSPLSEHEQAMLNTAVWSMQTHAPHPLKHYTLPSRWNNQSISLEDLESGEVCVERLSWIKNFGIFSTNSFDPLAFRAVAYHQQNIPTLNWRCPPRTVTLILRQNRRILNWQALKQMIHDKWRKDVQVVQIQSDTSSEAQIRTFAMSGLLLASHSSQLVNVMYTHPRAAVVEIAPEYYNSDFSEYAHGMGVFFRYAFGGTVPNATIDQSMTTCLDKLAECEGDSHCILNKRFEPVCRHRTTCCKYMDGFHADLAAVEKAIQHAINHLNWACGQVW